MSTVITIGNFDGVHLGHRAILDKSRALADRRGARVVALSFDPPPVAILAPAKAPPRLLPLQPRIERLKQAGADEVAVLDTTPDLLARSATDFVADLIARYEPVAFVEGEDFHFGHNREGDMALLETLGREHGFTAHIAPSVQVDLDDGTHAPVRSTLIRQLIGHARLLDAARCLAAPFEITARVVRGEQRGRTIGVPTVNLDPNDYAPYILPPDGVYAGLARFAKADADASHPAAISLGPKPTFQGKALTLEAHLLGFHADVYDQTVTLSFARFLRDQYPFPSLDALKNQLQHDIAQTRRLHDQGLLHLDR